MRAQALLIALPALTAGFFLGTRFSGEAAEADVGIAAAGDASGTLFRRIMPRLPSPYSCSTPRFLITSLPLRMSAMAVPSRFTCSWKSVPRTTARPAGVSTS